MAKPFRIVLAGQALIERAPSENEFNQMSGISSILSTAEFAFCDLEVAIKTSKNSFPTKDSVIHAAPVEILDVLGSVGFNTLALANNHFADLGPYAVVEGMQEIQARGFYCSGAGTTADTARMPKRIDNFSFSVVLAMPKPIPGRALNLMSEYNIPARPGVNAISVQRNLRASPEDFAALSRIVEVSGHSQRIDREILTGRKMAHNADLLDFYGLPVHQGDSTQEEAKLEEKERVTFIEMIEHEASAGFQSLVSIHYHDWEADWSVPPIWLKDLAHDCVDAGAFAVVGHGPPTMSGFEIYNKSLIAYGLGNLIFHTHRFGGYASPTIWESALMEVSFDENFSCTDVALHPICINRDLDGRPGFPRLAGHDKAVEIIERIEELNLRL